MANNENLQKGKATQFSGGVAARDAQKKSAASRKRNNTIRKLGQQMLQMPMDLGLMPTKERMTALQSLRSMGFETESPELQMVILARLGALAVSEDPKLMMDAAQMLLEITGNDVRSQIAAEQRKIDRERIKLEKARFEAIHKDADEEALAKLDQLIGSIDRIAQEAQADASE